MCASVGLEASTGLRCKFVQMKLLIGFRFKGGEVMSPVTKVSISLTVLLHLLM